MRVAILGTRGIPNYHGGFEQFAEFFAKYLVDNNHETYVYCSSLHPYKKGIWNDINLIHQTDPENRIGTSGQFIYDLNCILDSRSRNFDVIFQLGYTSSSIWSKLLPKGAKIITNMDGLEWKRSKYNRMVQKFLMYAEKLAVDNSDILVADSIGIQDYLKEKYSVDSKYIAYGVNPNNTFNDEVLADYQLQKENYNLLIARMEPENNIEVILDGYVRSKMKTKFVVVGKTDNGFGKYLVHKFKKYSNILFLGGVYDMDKLNSLRKNSNLYFHGHSVGGTNPSLLEAMVSDTLICAHENVFNRSILGENGFYFSNETDVSYLIKERNKEDYIDMVKRAHSMVLKMFSWQKINKEYLSLLDE